VAGPTDRRALGCSATVAGTEEQIERAFRDALVTLDRRISLFLSLPISSLGSLALAQEVQRIGKT
jgi:arsenate reductase (thioredoxin)